MLETVLAILVPIVYLALIVGTPLYVAGDVQTRDGDHMLAWAAISFFGAIFFWIPWMVFYLRVREDIHGSR